MDRESWSGSQSPLMCLGRGRRGSRTRRRPATVDRARWSGLLLWIASLKAAGYDGSRAGSGRPTLNRGHRSGRPSWIADPDRSAISKRVPWGGRLLRISGKRSAHNHVSSPWEWPAAADRGRWSGRYCGSLAWQRPVFVARESAERPANLDRGHGGSPLLWMTGTGAARSYGSQAGSSRLL